MPVAPLTGSRWNLALWTVLGLLGTSATFLFSYRFILHHYVTGPYVWDSGWFSYAIFRNGFELPNLPHLRQSCGQSLFTQHLYGLVSVASPLSHGFSTHYQYFATVLGATYALMFLGPFLAVRAQLASAATRLGAVSAFGAGLLFAFSGPVVAAIGYPHFEVAIPGFFMLFLALHFLHWRRLKWLALVAGLLVREDAGLHYLGYAVIIGLYQWWRNLAPLPRRTLLGMGALSVGVSFSMLFIQRHFYPLGSSMFQKSYVGDPPFSHLTLAQLGVRFTDFARDADHLYLPALIILGASLVLRCLPLALGYLACIPWVLVNVVFSLTPAARTLSLYYGFPLLLGLAWPLFAPHWMSPAAARSFRGRSSLPLVAIAALVSSFLLEHYAFPVAAARAGGRLDAATFLRIDQCLKEEFARTPGLYADTAVVALFPDAVPADRMFIAGQPAPATGADGLIFFFNGSERAYEALAQPLGLSHSTVLIGLPVRMLSRSPSALGECVLRPQRLEAGAQRGSR